MTTTTKSRSTKILRPTRRNQAIRRDGSLSRYREIWEAESADGQFLAERLEYPGTPWQLSWRPTEGDPMVWLDGLYGSLAQCERALAQGMPGYYLATRMMRMLGPIQNWA
jgi:hypothetical protein